MKTNLRSDKLIELTDPNSIIVSASLIYTSENDGDISVSNEAFRKIYTNRTFIEALEKMTINEINSVMEATILYKKVCNNSELLILQKTIEILQCYIRIVMIVKK
jgi:hypothetical protein